MYTTRRGRVALQHSEVEEIKTLFNNLCSDDGRVDLYWFISSQIEKIDSLGSIKNTRFHVCLFDSVKFRSSAKIILFSSLLYI